MTDLPDWHGGVAPLRPVMGENQARYMATAAGAIAGAGGTAYLDITAPADYNIIISFLAISSPVSCINYVYLQINTITYFWHYYDTSCFLAFPTEGAPTIPAGSTLTINIVNNDANTQTLRISVGGLYEQI